MVQRPVSRLYKIEGKEGNVNSDILNKDNVNKGSDLSETAIIDQKGKPQVKQRSLSSSSKQ